MDTYTYVYTYTFEVNLEHRLPVHALNVFSNLDEVQWKDFPLGKLPGQADEPDGLMVEHYSVMSLIDQPMTRDERHSPSMK